MPSTELATFLYTTHPVRMFGDTDDPWFMLSDICTVLGIKNPTDAARRLDDDETKRDRVQTPGGLQSAVLVNEFGLYELILTSRSAAAKPFKQWVKREVLPAIRRSGQYLTDEARSVYTDRRRTMAYDVRDLFRLADKHPAAAADIRRIARDINDTALYGWMESLASPDSNRQIREIAPPNV